MIQCVFSDQWQWLLPLPLHGLYRLELFVQATAKDTRSRLMLNNVMRDVTLPVGVLWKAVKKLSAFL